MQISYQGHANLTSRSNKYDIKISSKKTHQFLLLQFPLLPRQTSFSKQEARSAVSAKKKRGTPKQKLFWSSFGTSDTSRFSSRTTWRPNPRVFHVDPRKKSGNAPRNGAERAEEDRIALAACARTIHGGRESRSRGSVRVRTGDSGPSADSPGSTSRRSERRHGNREHDGKGRARLSSAVYGKQPARRSSKCHWWVCPPCARALSLFFSLCLSRSLESAYSWLSSSTAGSISLGHLSRGLSVEDHFPDPVIERRAIAGCETGRECDCPSSRFPR